MFGFGSSSPAKGSDVHRAQQLVQDDNEEQDLAGVGIVFVRAPDDSLFVKSIIDGSGAQNSGIQVGDCLMKVGTYALFLRQLGRPVHPCLHPAGFLSSKSDFRVCMFLAAFCQGCVQKHATTLAWFLSLPCRLC
jgi:hypothetical protein